MVGSPFHWNAAGDPSVFREWTDLVAEAKWDVSYLSVADGKAVFRDLDLSKFNVVLLDPRGLLQASPEDVNRVRAFAESGGRLVLAANSFYWGSVDAANKVLDGYGLKMLNKEGRSARSGSFRPSFSTRSPSPQRSSRQGSSQRGSTVLRRSSSRPTSQRVSWSRP